jgi:hypothetical protein
VIAEKYGVSDDPTKGNASEFDMGYEELGRIGSSLRFVPSNSRIETRSLFTYRAISTAAGWRIEGKQPDGVRVTVAATAAYLRRVRDETKDRILRENAEKTLTKLASYR